MVSTGNRADHFTMENGASLFCPVVITTLVPFLDFGDFCRLRRALGKDSMLCTRDVGAHFSAELGFARQYSIDALCRRVCHARQRCAGCGRHSSGKMQRSARVVCLRCSRIVGGYHQMVDRRELRRRIDRAAESAEPDAAEAYRRLRSRVREVWSCPDRVSSSNRYLYRLHRVGLA